MSAEAMVAEARRFATAWVREHAAGSLTAPVDVCREAWVAATGDASPLAVRVVMSTARMEWGMQSAASSAGPVRLASARCPLCRAVFRQPTERAASEALEDHMGEAHW